MSTAPGIVQTAPPLSLPCTASPCGYSTPTQVKRTKKKKNATNFFLCFRSVDVIVPDKPGQHPRDVFSYVAMGEKESMVFPKVVPVTPNEGDYENCRTTQHRTQGQECGISQVLKAVLLKTSLVNRIQKRKSERKFADGSTYNQEWAEEAAGLPKVSPMAPLLLDNKENEEKDDDQYGRNKARSKLSRVLRAFLFETSLAKKIRKRNKGKTFARNESSKYNQEMPEEDDSRKHSDTASSSFFTTSSVNSLSSSSSQSSASSSRSLSKRIKSFRSNSSRNFKANLRYLSDKIRSNSNNVKANSRSYPNKNKVFEANSGSKDGQGWGQDKDVINIEKNKKLRRCNYMSIISLCFLLMSLLGLIFYGKICAILCTSMWLLSVPLWTGLGDCSSNKVDRKKFIIGGLLARDSRIIHRP